MLSNGLLNDTKKRRVCVYKLEFNTSRLDFFLFGGLICFYFGSFSALIPQKVKIQILRYQRLEML